MLAFEERGEGPAIVCTHAIGHDRRDFAPLLRALSGRRRVIAVDWPLEGAAHADRYASLLHELLDAKRIERPILIGNSIGAAAALKVATEREVRGLVIANSGGLFARNWLSRATTRAFAAFFRAGARGARWFPRAFGAYYRVVLSRREAAEQRARIVARAYEIAPLLADAWARFGDASSDYRDLPARVRAPVLVCWAARDLWNPLWASLPALRKFRDVRIVRHRAGHNPYLEDTAQFLEVFDEFERGLA